jgi:hypothetical protein
MFYEPIKTFKNLLPNQNQYGNVATQYSKFSKYNDFFSKKNSD